MTTAVKKAFRRKLEVRDKFFMSIVCGFELVGQSCAVIYAIITFLLFSFHYSVRFDECRHLPVKEIIFGKYCDQQICRLILPK